MLYFNNPKRRVAGRKKRRTTKKRRVRVRRVARLSTGAGAMAKRRRKSARRRPVARRRRRRRSGTGAAVALRRRGATVYRSNPRRRRRRRHYGHNPIGGGVVTILKRGVIDGAVILVSQTATSKAMALADRFVPISGIAGAAVKGLGVPVAITLIARKALPKYAPLIAAAAFAQGLHGILALTPIGGFLGAYPGDSMAAWPGGQLSGEDDGMSGQWDENQQ